MALEDVLGSLLGFFLACIPCALILAIPAFFVGIVVVLIWFASKQKGVYEETLKSIALETGGEFKKGSMWNNPVLSGEYKGRKLFIDTFSRTHEDSDHHRTTTYYMRIQLWHKASLEGEVEISREGLFSGLGKMMGAQDIQIGSEEFDKAFVVKGDENLAKRLLDSDLQKRLLESKILVRVLKDRVYFERVGHISDKAKILEILDFMSYVAEKVEKL